MKTKCLFTTTLFAVTLLATANAVACSHPTAYYGIWVENKTPVTVNSTVSKQAASGYDQGTPKPSGSSSNANIHSGNHGQFQINYTMCSKDDNASSTMSWVLAYSNNGEFIGVCAVTVYANSAGRSDGSSGLALIDFAPISIKDLGTRGPYKCTWDDGSTSNKVHKNVEMWTEGNPGGAGDTILVIKR